MKADKIPPQKRSEIMSSVKSKGTKLEIYFAEKLDEKGLVPFHRNDTSLVGKPDFVYKEVNVAIFIDSCFWHGCKQHLRMPHSNRDYWTSKITRNRRRDRKVTQQLKKEGWLVLRIWEHSIKNPRALKWWLTRIENLIRMRRSSRAE